MLHFRAIVSIGLLGISLAAVDTWAQTKRLDYDTYCAMNLETKKKVFVDVTPENRAELVRTQIQRWLDKNRSRLTADQIKVMEDNIAFVKADLYKFPRKESDLDQAKRLEQRTLAVMTREDMGEALTIYGACIPKG